jgi:predicted anti-sigma-YlaC factor YlaD
VTTHPLHDLGAYVLGALPADEEAQIREHLARCDECRREHGRLSALPALLDLGEAEPDRPAVEPPSPLLEDAVLAGFRGVRPSRPRRRLSLPSLRVALPSAALGALLAVAALAIGGAFSGDDAVPTTTAVELSGTSGSARAVLAADEVGTVIELDARLPPSGRDDHYDVYMLAGDYEISAGSFRVDADGHVTARLACGGAPDAYDAIVVRRDEKAVLTAQL